jgi:hypothetical protein
MVDAPIGEVVDTQLHFGTLVPFKVGASIPLRMEPALASCAARLKKGFECDMKFPIQARSGSKQLRPTFSVPEIQFSKEGLAEFKTTTASS